jgi:putative transcriptional regulator
MTKQISNRFRILLAEKATREQRNIALKEVGRSTGIAWSTLNAWANNQVTRYDAPVIKALCEYFTCQVGDLIIYEREERIHE